MRKFITFLIHFFFNWKCIPNAVWDHDYLRCSKCGEILGYRTIDGCFHICVRYRRNKREIFSLYD